MIRILAISLFLTCPDLASAQVVNFGPSDQDRSAPVQVSADALSVNQTDGTALYTGNVVIVQGQMRLAAPRVLVVYLADASKIDHLEATGGVTLVSGDEAAEARQAEYDIDGGFITMIGDVLVTQGDNVMSAQRMLVDLDAGSAKLDGRVSTVLEPASNGTKP